MPLANAATTIINTTTSLVLLEQHFASSSTTLDFTNFLSSVYDEYLIETLNIIPATTASILTLQMGTGVGPTWDSTAGHYQFSGYFAVFNASSFSGSTSTTAINLSATLSSTVSLGGTTGFYRLYSPLSATMNKIINGQAVGAATTNTNNISTFQVAGAYLQTTVLTGLRFVFSSGNIASGIIRIYGVSK